MEGHAGTAWIGEHVIHAMVDQALHEDVGPALQGSWLGLILGIRLLSHFFAILVGPDLGGATLVGLNPG